MSIYNVTKNETKNIWLSEYTPSYTAVEMTFPVLTVHKMPPDLHMYIYHKCPGLPGAVFCISRVSQHLSPCMLFDIIHKRVTGNGTSHHREKRGRHKAGRGDGGGRDFQLPTHYTSSWVKIAPPQRSSLQWCPSLRTGSCISSDNYCWVFF